MLTPPQRERLENLQAKLVEWQQAADDAMDEGSYCDFCCGGLDDLYEDLWAEFSAVTGQSQPNRSLPLRHLIAEALEEHYLATYGPI